MHRQLSINIDCSVNKVGVMFGACFFEWGWGQECQSIPNFGSELQLDFRRCSRSLQKFPLLDPGPVHSLRRRESSSLYDMQRCRLMIACIFILFHDKVAIQWKNNLLITHIIFFFFYWAIIYRVYINLVSFIRQYVQINYYSIGLKFLSIID
jgi:hypothetical protein